MLFQYNPYSFLFEICTDMNIAPCFFLSAELITPGPSAFAEGDGDCGGSRELIRVTGATESAWGCVERLGLRKTPGAAENAGGCGKRRGLRKTPGTAENAGDCGKRRGIGWHGKAFKDLSA